MKNKIGSPIPINLPEDFTIKVEKEALILDHKIMKITIKVIFNSWVRSIDARSKLILDIPQDEKNNYATISGSISFKAEFKVRSIFSRDTEKHIEYVRNMLTNLKSNYSWSEYLKSLREYAFWKHMSKDD